MQQAVLIQQQAIMMPGHHKEYVHIDPVQNTGDISSRPVLPSLQIHLLGMFLLAYDRIPVLSIDMPRLQSLLAYLVLHHNVPQSRTRLASLLWPDSTEEQAHTNLRNLLYKLRQALSEIERWLTVDRYTLLWRSDGSWTVDALDFERAAARAEQAEQEGDHATLRLALEQAVELYRGELLPGCYDEWILLERERLSQLFLGVLEQLLHLREQEGDYPGAIRVAQRLIREDPLQEVSYRHLMRLYAANGNRAAVVRTYQHCATVLKRELAVEPSSMTRRIYDRIIQPEKFSSFTTMKRSEHGLEAMYAPHPGQK